MPTGPAPTMTILSLVSVKSTFSETARSKIIKFLSQSSHFLIWTILSRNPLPKTYWPDMTLSNLS